MEEPNSDAQQILENMDEGTQGDIHHGWSNTKNTPLGKWIPNMNASQNWATYRDIDTDTLYMSPQHTTRTWTAHAPVSAKGRTLIYNNKPGEPCTPPKRGVKVFLQSQTQYTMIFINSYTIPVILRSTHIRQPNPSTKKGLTRIIGPSMELQGDKNELVKALEQGTL